MTTVLVCREKDAQCTNPKCSRDYCYLLSNSIHEKQKPMTQDEKVKALIDAAKKSLPYIDGPGLPTLAKELKAALAAFEPEQEYEYVLPKPKGREWWIVRGSFFITLESAEYFAREFKQDIIHVREVLPEEKPSPLP